MEWDSQVALVVNKTPINAGDVGGDGSIPGSGRSPGVGNGSLLQHSCLGNPMGRRAVWATVHRVAGRVGRNLGTKKQQKPHVYHQQFLEQMEI